MRVLLLWAIGVHSLYGTVRRPEWCAGQDELGANDGERRAASAGSGILLRFSVQSGH